MTPSTPASTAAGALADANRKDAEEFCKGAFGPFVTDVSQYVDIVAELLQHATDRARNSAPALPDNYLSEKNKSAAAALRNSAPQETRGDEPVAWRCRGEDGFYTSWFDGKPPNYYGPYEVAYAAPQQSPRLEREGIIQIIEEKMLDAWNTICSDTDCHPMDIEQLGRRKIGFHNSHWSQFTAEMSADAILALLSPDTSVVTSTEQVWQPADTAPQDGSTIEVRFLTDNPRRVRWSQSDCGTYWHLADSNGPAIINFNPTEWRPASSNHPREVGK